MQDDLRSLFRESLAQFADDDSLNILNGTSERNLCARFALVLERNAHASGFEGYFADVEYNRNLGRVKTIINDRMEVVAVTCDLILHSRGQKPARDNLIAVEMKRREHPEADKASDRIRLQALTKDSYDDVWSYDGKTLPEHVCGYQVGYFVELDLPSSSFTIEEFIDGQLCDNWTHQFD